jgi:hypothetical protein
MGLGAVQKGTLTAGSHRTHDTCFSAKESRFFFEYSSNFFYLYANQQSEYSVFHKLMSWQESSLWTI